MFGISDSKVYERLLREADLTLAKTDEICHAAESISQKLKLVEPQELAVHTVERLGGDMLSSKENCVQHIVRLVIIATSKITLQLCVARSHNLPQ